MAVVYYGDEEPPKRGLKYLGKDGTRATTSVEFRQYVATTRAQPTGQFGERRPRMTNEERRSLDADNFASKPHFLHDKMFSEVPEKATCDYPTGGKSAKRFWKDNPNPLSHGEQVVSLTGKPKRIEPVIFTDEQKKAFWSEGRASQLRTEAEHFGQMKSVIPHFDQTPYQEKLKLGTKKVGHGQLPPIGNCVSGFKGVGNTREGMRNTRGNEDAPARHAHAESNMTFHGRRRNEYGPSVGQTRVGGRGEVPQQWS